MGSHRAASGEFRDRVLSQSESDNKSEMNLAGMLMGMYYFYIHCRVAGNWGGWLNAVVRECL